MAYTVPEQRALAWGGGFGGFGGCGFGFGGCGGFFGFHKHIIQTISQTNRCFDPQTHTPPTPPPPTGKEVARGGSGGSGGAGGSGGEGGQGGKNVGDITTTANINQKANGGNSNGGHAGNANGGDARTQGNQQDQNQQAWGSDHQDQNQKDKHVLCLNTAVNNAGHGFGTNGVASDNLGQSDVPDNLLR